MAAATCLFLATAAFLAFLAAMNAFFYLFINYFTVNRGFGAAFFAFLAFFTTAFAFLAPFLAFLPPAFAATTGFASAG